MPSATTSSMTSAFTPPTMTGVTASANPWASGSTSFQAMRIGTRCPSRSRSSSGIRHDDQEADGPGIQPCLSGLARHR